MQISKIIKATIKNIIVALFLSIATIVIVYLIFRREIDLANSIVDKFEIEKVDASVITTITPENVIKNYPSYGSEYGNIKIEKIDVDLPVYLGDTLEILKKGVGHNSGSYFPGEGGSILYSGHNFVGFFRRFSELEKNDIIEVTTDYGRYKYQIYDMQIIKETQLDKVPIQKEKEVLMVFTCYPFNNVGYTTSRYVVYANRIE